MNHFEVSTKMQLHYALKAGAFPTYEEARANPFTIDFANTNFRLRFPNGLHERAAERAANRVRRLGAKYFTPRSA